MATSRTGTARYLRNRRRCLEQAQRDGLTHCPGFDGHACGVELDYDIPQQPNSAEADHILEHRHGGTDDFDNLRVLCRACNTARNRTKARVEVPTVADFPTSRAW